MVVKSKPKSKHTKLSFGSQTVKRKNEDTENIQDSNKKAKLEEENNNKNAKDTSMDTTEDSGPELYEMNGKKYNITLKDAIKTECQKCRFVQL